MRSQVERESKQIHRPRTLSLSGSNGGGSRVSQFHSLLVILKQKHKKGNEGLEREEQNYSKQAVI